MWHGREGNFPDPQEGVQSSRLPAGEREDGRWN